ncbi:hypothetical protein [Planomicrobium okeanokoites]|uniref:hypothetical protein n=1 Tax=Planomicrobium okeanokoites TaxID=244 RepID=UPI00249296A6|nr:hypothetical protein [Planomicrobium okeanokoites]
MKNRWIIILIVGLTLMVIGGLWFLSSAPKETAQEEVELEESLMEIENTVDATQKANNFILDKIPNDEVFLKFHLENGEHKTLTKEEYQTAALEMFYGAVSEENTTYLTTALTPESFQAIWGKEMDFAKREEKLIHFLNELNGNDTLVGMKYKLELDKFDQPNDNGTIILSYSDGSTKEVPFSFVKMGEGHEQITQLQLTDFTLDKDAN